MSWYNMWSKLREHLERECLGTPYIESMTVDAIFNTVMVNQGSKLLGDISIAVEKLAESISAMVKNPPSNEFQRLPSEEVLRLKRPVAEFDFRVKNELKRRVDQSRAQLLATIADKDKEIAQLRSRLLQPHP